MWQTAHVTDTFCDRSLMWQTSLEQFALSRVSTRKITTKTDRIPSPSASLRKTLYAIVIIRLFVCFPAGQNSVGGAFNHSNNYSGNK